MMKAVMWFFLVAAMVVTSVQVSRLDLSALDVGWAAFSVTLWLFISINAARFAGSLEILDEFIEKHLDPAEVQRAVDRALSNVASDCDRASQRVITFQRGGLEAINAERQKDGYRPWKEEEFDECRIDLNRAFRRGQNKFYALYDFFQRLLRLLARMQFGSRHGDVKLKNRAFKAYLPDVKQEQ